ncbi:oligosaccharide flippase family protein [Candidatus Symbiothrix dinenymphae]|uniref:oligosaccharide flippase family protein n=1 Tax=Candidatus Symbiothrix dinenymphae TaxID=467085 RepID=UPI0006C0D92B|nr:oligosaccharide flippase family protein [Candidatus Symbiothrix dinenymphae]GAP73424.1 polysaccharide biosynthesis protein [Candidatus Symbiothrix dinenymphae]
MAQTKSLLKDSVIYGGSSILQKMMTWLMTTLLTNTLSPTEFGIFNHVYAYAVLMLVLLTFGLETGCFRFANQKDKYNPSTVFSTALMMVMAFTAVFLFIFLFFLPDIRPYVWKDLIPSTYLRLLFVFVSMDVVSAIPFAYLRYKKRPIKFAALKILNVVLYVLFCIFFLVVCPWLQTHYPALVTWYDKSFNVGYVLIANLLATGIETACLLPEFISIRFRFDRQTAKKLFVYSFPLMLMGVAGMSNLVADKIIYPFIPKTNISELGIYSACFKIAQIMMMFTQAFRYAYDPFVFEKSNDAKAKEHYSKIMTWFVICGLLIFLVVTFYLDIIKYFIGPDFWSGLDIVPLILLGELFFAIYYNLSLWYKLTDKTYWGTTLAIITCLLVVVINIVFVPIYSYRACAWAALIANGVTMLLSYFLGQKYYPIHYNLKTIGFYFALAAALYAISRLAAIENVYQHMAFNTLLLAVYAGVLVKRDMPLKDIPVINRIFAKK